MDTYGEDTIITTKERDIELVPRLNKTVCLIFDNGDAVTSGIGAGSFVAGSTPVLPDLSDWPYVGEREVNGESVHLWRYEKKHSAKMTVYSFYIREDGTPVRLHQRDDWLIDFTSYTPGAITKSVFEMPELCDGVKPGNRSVGTSGFAWRMQRLLPGANVGTAGSRNAAYDAFAAEHGRVHGSPEEYARRLGIYRANVEFISRHNAQNSKSHTLAVNHFADWSEEEFLSIMLPSHGKYVQRPEHSSDLLHHAVTPKERIPAQVDWRGTGADGPVKDQSACGSCWAFGAVGAAQTAYFMATGEQRLFSEQQLMDCSWGHTHNKACDGGLYEGAYHYLTHGEGVPLALESDYPYRGQDSFCRDNRTAVVNSPGRFKGFRAIPRQDKLALMEALYTKGPLAVSIDAGNPSFRFYSSGVYDEPACKWKQDELDHSVMLVGYGSTEGGKDYWTVKNSWSRFWGDKGYVHISRDHHGCGIATDAIYAVVDTDAVSAAGSVTAQQ
jgi:cathepsin L